MLGHERLLGVVGLLVLGLGCGSGSGAKQADGGGGTNPQGAAGSSSAGASGGGTGSAGAAGGATGAAGHQGAAGSGASPGEAPLPGPPCRTSADCPATYYTCGPSLQTYPCGGIGGGIPQSQCSGDAGCTPDQICVAAAPGPCFVGAVLGHVCTSRCTSTSCATGLTCDTTSGLCGPTPCGAAYACPVGLTCAPTRAAADTHGCATAKCDTDGYKCPDGWTCGAGQALDTHGCSAVSCVGGAVTCPVNTDCKAGSTGLHNCAARACTADKTCDCGACINGYCQNHLWVCSPPPPV